MTGSENSFCKLTMPNRDSYRGLKTIYEEGVEASHMVDIVDYSSKQSQFLTLMVLMQYLTVVVLAVQN